MTALPIQKTDREPGGSSYLRDVACFSMAQAFAGMALLFYSLTAARLLGPNEFGLFQALMGLFGILTVYGTPLYVATMHVVASAEEEVKRAVAGKCLLTGLIMGSVVAVLVLALSPLLKTVLHCQSPAPLAALALFLVSCSVLTAFYGALQGQNRYVFYSVVKVAESGSIPCIGIALILIGGGAAGAVAGYALGMGLAVLFLLTRSEIYRVKETASFARMNLREVAPLLAVLGILFVISDFPIIVARNRLSSGMTGIFGALFSLRNIVFTFAFAVAVPLYSRRVSGKYEAHLFLKSLGIIVLMSVALLCGAAFLGEWFIRKAFGAEYVQAAPYLLMYCVGLSLHSVCTVLMFNSAGRLRPSSVLLMIPVFMMLGLFAVPDLTIERIILAQIISLLFCVVVSVGQGNAGSQAPPAGI